MRETQPCEFLTAIMLVLSRKATRFSLQVYRNIYKAISFTMRRPELGDFIREGLQLMSGVQNHSMQCVGEICDVNCN